MTLHWTETADRVTTGNPRILGEDEDGEILVPSSYDPPLWGPKRFDAKNPLHWRFWLRSRLTNKLAMVERA